ncbi:hypothetical protein BLOT_012448 [Blomia tropicalis]|nr:hypothetical protein BLOT_012448 [Blomia tropicalis]
MELFSRVPEIFLDYIIVDSDAFKLISNEDLNCLENSCIELLNLFKVQSISNDDDFCEYEEPTPIEDDSDDYDSDEQFSPPSLSRPPSPPV